MVVLPLLERLGRRELHRRGFRSRWTDTPSGRVHAFDAAGEGTLPTIVVFHGLGSASTAFLPVLARLRRHAKRVVAIDGPGHGFSDEPAAKLTPEAYLAAIEHALDALVPERAVLVGNSLGGAIALGRAIHRPDTVAALVLLSPAGSHTTDEDWARIRRLFTIDTRSDARAFLERIYHRPPRLLTYLLAFELPRSVGRAPVRDLLASASNADCPSPEAVKALAMPILLSWGRSERLFSEQQLAWFRDHLPAHAVLEQPEGFGHCPHFDRPGQVAERIVAFARDVAAHT